MRRARIEIVTTSCRRCGKALATASRSLHGADAAKARFGSICSDCVTPAEREEMLHAIAGAILGGAR